MIWSPLGSPVLLYKDKLKRILIGTPASKTLFVHVPNKIIVTEATADQGSQCRRSYNTSPGNLDNSPETWGLGDTTCR